MAARILPLLVCLGLLCGTAFAGDPPDQRTTGLVRIGGSLRMSLGLPDLFTDGDLQRLLSGFTTRVLIRAVVLRVEDGEVVSEATRVAEIVYDLWDEKIRVRVSSGHPLRLQTQVADSPKAAMEIATSLVVFPVADLRALSPGVSYRIRVRADLNPISEELLLNLRRWLSPSAGRGRAGDSFFGSFISVFVNPRIDDSERMLQTTSQIFVEPPRSP